MESGDQDQLEGPTLAGVWDALGGGKDNRAADREHAARLEEIAVLSELVAANADFRRRAVEWLAGPGRVAQFLDCGPGFPDSSSTSTVVRRIAPTARVMYVDHDPVVLAHARALLATDGNIRVLDADIFDPKAVVQDPEVESFLDWSEPVAVLHTATLPHCPDEPGPLAVMQGYLEVLRPGSYTVISHFTTPDHPDLERLARGAETELLNGPLGTGRFRTPDEIASLFPSQDLLAPGLVPCDAWHPDTEAGDHPAGIRNCLLGAIGQVRHPGSG